MAGGGGHVHPVLPLVTTPGCYPMPVVVQGQGVQYVVHSLCRGGRVKVHLQYNHFSLHSSLAEALPVIENPQITKEEQSSSIPASGS